MRSTLKVLALKADDGGCGYYRIILPAYYAAQHGVEIEVLEDLPVDMSVKTNGEVVVHRIDTDADVIIFQRPLLHAFYPAIVQAQKQGIACVIELDDDLGAVHRENLAYDEVDPRQNQTSNHLHLRKAMQIADWCVVSTPTLARRYAPHGRVSVIRNVLPESTWKIEKSVPGHARVGWTGSIVTHPRDLEAAGAHVGTVLKNTGSRLSIIGDGQQVRERLLIPEIVDIDVHGWRKLDEYHQAIADLIDIGIVPLEDSIFNESKSHLKGLEFAAVGVPFIASPTSEYIRMSKMGVGKIAYKGIDWQKYIRRLVLDRDFLLEESANVREASRSLTYENHIGEWLTAWMCAVEYRSRVSQ